LFRADLLLA